MSQWGEKRNYRGITVLPNVETRGFEQPGEHAIVDAVMLLGHDPALGEAEVERLFSRVCSAYIGKPYRFWLATRILEWHHECDILTFSEDEILSLAMGLSGTRWNRPDYVKALGPYNGYEVVAVTNVFHQHNDHPPQVVYKGDNGRWWSLPLASWPGRLQPEIDEDRRTRCAQPPEK